MPDPLYFLSLICIFLVNLVKAKNISIYYTIHNEIARYKEHDIDHWRGQRMVNINQKHHQFSQSGCPLWVRVTEIIHGTIYVVTGSYEGSENFVRKLERITSRKFAEKLEDSE